AHGGYVGARAGGGGPRGGRVLVGEQGPELVSLPYGSKVHSNADSQRMMGEGRGSNINITVNAPNYVGTPSDLLRALVDAKRRGQLDVILR
ncbi:MAG TPA: hypothetical protein VJW23_02980, partial [Propionibacteriaceae bacterium]|nr:hypothetical protein [Propionibacteriaceae bacterium]